MLSCFFYSCNKENDQPQPLNFVKYTINGLENFNLRGSTIVPEIKVYFSLPLDIVSARQAVKLSSQGQQVDLNIVLTQGDSVLIITPINPLKYISKYDFTIDNQLKTKKNENLSSTISSSFTTQIDDSDKFPIISDEDLMTLVQEQTFKYFWDFAHPVSGLSRERNTSGDLVTSGGSGFGIMSIVVGIERGFITRQQGLERLTTITDFLRNKVRTYHGVFPHWFNGVTGATIPFSAKDNGGDIVETSFLIAGLLCASEYFDQSTAEESNLRSVIKEIWEDVEWNWHTKGTENVLYWHWSPNFGWEMNHRLTGWNEALITYVLAAASPTYPISKEVYDKGWANNGGMKNNKNFYGVNLPLGPDLGGPLFFAHYSFLGLDPRNLKDEYADYWVQQVNHTKINFAYCVDNPRNYSGYSAECWGLTASDTNNGYTAHSPTNDRGVITPTAALSSFPYTPIESSNAMRFFYYKLGDKLFKQYGFVDAFNLTNIWFANSFLAIDQGPIIIMMENHRTGLIWNYTMQNEDIQRGLDRLGFSY